MGMEKINVARRVPTDIAVVVFGTDRAKKQHASRFGSEAAKSALAAARAMGMRTIHVRTPEQRDVALKLPKGSVSAAGKAVVPFVKLALYQKLLAVAGSDTPPPSQPSPKSATAHGEGTKSPAAPDRQADAADKPPVLAKGAIVLATDDPAGASWWPASVQFIDGELLTLRWQSAEWKDLPAFIRRLSQVAVQPKGKPC